MLIKGEQYRTIWPDSEDNETIKIIDQRKLPHKFEIEELTSVNDFVIAIKDMHVRGAPLVGAAGAYGMYLSALQAPKLEGIKPFMDYLNESAERLNKTRPTAVNLDWAITRMLNRIKGERLEDVVEAAFNEANKIADEEVNISKKIGKNGLPIIKKISEEKDDSRVNILTHCNAGALATVDYGLATAPMYAAHDNGIDIHVYADKTGPRNQGSRLTAWELGEQGVPYKVIEDNTGGHLMQNNLVDLVIVGTDRTLHTGYVANKIGTYLKALAAKDNNVPFYVALPSSTIDWKLRNREDINIEKRDGKEVKYTHGLTPEDNIGKVLVTPKNALADNYAFDVTPPRLITGLITDKGVCEANEKSIRKLYNK